VGTLVDRDIRRGPRTRKGDVPTRDEVAKKLHELIDRLDRADEQTRERLSGSVPARVIQIDVPDVDVSFWSELRDGRLDGLHEGANPDADIRVTADSGILVDLVDGKRSLFSSYVGGHVRIDASMADLLALRKLL
jgi:hypothetical protein